MIHEFEVWSAARSEVNTLSDLEGAVIGIEAFFYLNRLLTQPPFKEPLLSALGGLPFALEAHIRNELEVFQNNGITPIFVFNGLEAGNKATPFVASNDAARENTRAWELYHHHHVEKAVDTFGNSGFAKPEDFYRLLQLILHRKKVEFQVAPYSAWGQLAYLARNDYVDGIAGSSELLMFEVDKVITHIDFNNAEFTFVYRQACIEELGLSSADIFVDACILSGSSLLPPLPTLDVVQARKPVIRSAIEAMKSHGSTGISLCLQLQENRALQSIDYLDRFRKSRLAVKHQVVLTSTGCVEPLTQKNIPNDFHEIIGQRLPEELYYYMSKAVIGSRILNQITSQQICELAPADGGASDEYHTLVREKLNPVRISTLSLLSHSLTRAYQHRDVKLRCWFDETSEAVISHSDYSSPSPVLSKWNVHQDLLSDDITLSYALKSLGDPAFAANTLSSRDSENLLSSKYELMANSMWRFLHLRGYINEKHELTGWGKVLAAMMPKDTSRPEAEEAAILATELLRLNVLNANSMFTMYSGLPIHGSDTDKRNCLLVSRIACLGKLHHQSIGFTGPLSRHLLAYSSVINVVRTSLRDLLEASLATLLLNGDADRSTSTDLTDVALSLPLLLPSDCSLGIAMKQYLDELSAYDDLSYTKKEEILTRGPKDWFPYSEDLRGDLTRAFEIWDGLYAGVKVAAKAGLVKDKDMWDGIEAWLVERRL